MIEQRALLLLCLAASACEGREHGHPHDDGGGGPAAAGKEEERPDLSVTAYESGLELFMEYPALVVGQPSPLVAHFTDARDPRGFRAVTKGRVVATLAYAAGGEDRFVAEELLRDGIFKPVVTPTRAGAATLTLVLEGPQVAGRVSAGNVQVFPTVPAAVAGVPEEEGGEATVGYLKEQQWKTDYATALAEVRVLQGGVHANGELRPVPGQAVELAAPVGGRVVCPDPVTHVGQVVKKGQLLASVVPIGGASQTDRAGLELEATRSRAELGLAERDVTRAEELLAAKAVPEKHLDAARVARDVAAARFQAAERQLSLYRSSQGGGSGGGSGAAFELRSPIDGVVSFADVTPGAVVEPGARLAAVVNSERLWLVAQVYEADVPRVEAATGARFTVAGFERDFVVDEKNGRKVAVGSVIDPGTRTVPVIFELPNPGGGALKPGMYARVTIFTGATTQGVAVPAEAVLDDGGRPTVFVLDGGESFFKRRVKVGVKAGDLVQILEGVAEGERVVSVGSYEIKLSTASGAIPEHGHQH